MNHLVVSCHVVSNFYGLKRVLEKRRFWWGFEWTVRRLTRRRNKTAFSNFSTLVWKVPISNTNNNLRINVNIDILYFVLKRKLCLKFWWPKSMLVSRSQYSPVIWQTINKCQRKLKHFYLEYISSVCFCSRKPAFASKEYTIKCDKPWCSENLGKFLLYTL